jgi:hypothetical protein
MMEGSGTLEQQLEATKRKAVEVRARRSDLKKIEDLGATLEEHLILDNRYTEHSTVGLAQVRKGADNSNKVLLRKFANVESFPCENLHNSKVFLRKFAQPASLPCENLHNSKVSLAKICINLKPHCQKLANYLAKMCNFSHRIRTGVAKIGNNVRISTADF